MLISYLKALTLHEIIPMVCFIGGSMIYEERSYQTTLIQATEALLEKHGRAALCVTCGGGKTWMANKIIRNYLDKNPTERVLILAHGRTQLRDQFFADLSEDIDDVAQWLEGECPTSRVVVALPHMRRKNIPKFGMVVSTKPTITIPLVWHNLFLLKQSRINFCYYFFKNPIEKTMIAATSIPQANQIYEILLQQGINAVVSTSKNDKNSILITEFYQNPTIAILIVVDRGILGFDMPKLRNVIDMSGSENPDILFQLLGRASRSDKTERPKVFIKIAPKWRVERTELITCFALALTTSKVYESYDGSFMTPFPYKKPT
jgi:superfamily II DNA or RNA helicase